MRGGKPDAGMSGKADPIVGVKSDIRTEILRMLGDGEYHSGESIGAAIGVTRAAVWKYIAALRKDGINVDAAPNKGYRLERGDDIRPALVLSGLKGAFGGELRFEESVDSTHRMAKEWAAEARSGSLCLAEEQTSGRGRMGRGWYAPRGSGLWTSVILRPEIPPARIQTLTMLTAVCVCRAIEKTCSLAASAPTLDSASSSHGVFDKPLIKWPNDVVIGGKKVCGILLEMSADMDRVNWIIISAGINVRFRDDGTQLAREMGQAAAFLERAYDRPVVRRELLWNYLSELENAVEAWTSGGGEIPDELMDAYIKRSVTLGQAVRATSPNFDLSGIAEKIDSEGALWIRTDAGELTRVIAGDVSVRGIMGYV